MEFASIGYIHPSRILELAPLLIPTHWTHTARLVFQPRQKSPGL